MKERNKIKEEKEKDLNNLNFNEIIFGLFLRIIFFLFFSSFFSYSFSSSSFSHENNSNSINNSINYNYYSWIFNLYLIPSKYSINNLNECIFINLKYSHQFTDYNNDNDNNNINSCPSNYILIFIQYIIFNSYFNFLFNVLLQLFNYYYFKKYNNISGLFYWFNPIIIISSLLSPIPTLLHFIILQVISLTIRNNFILSFPLMIILLLIDLNYFIPFVMTITSYFFYQNINLKFSSLRSFYGITYFIIFYLFYWFLFDDIAITSKQRVPSKYFEPGYGIMWYLQAQVFPEYYNYFYTLVKFQPFLISIPLIIRLSKHDILSTVSLLNFLFI